MCVCDRVSHYFHKCDRTERFIPLKPQLPLITLIYISIFFQTLRRQRCPVYEKSCTSTDPYGPIRNKQPPWHNPNSFNINVGINNSIHLLSVLHAGAAPGAEPGHPLQVQRAHPAYGERGQRGGLHLVPPALGRLLGNLRRRYEALGPGVWTLPQNTVYGHALSILLLLTYMCTNTHANSLR